MSNNQAHPDAPNLPYYVATYQGRSVAIKRDADYQATIKLVQKSIPKLRSADIQDIFISTTLADFGDTLVQISEEIWPDFVSHVRTVEITLEDPACVDHPVSGRVDGGDGNGILTQPGERIVTVATTVELTTEDTYTRSRAAPYRAVQDPTNTSIDSRETFSIRVSIASQELLELSGLRPSSTISDIKSSVEATYNVPAILQRLDLLDQPLDDSKTLKQYNITDWTILDLHLNARQCMIYFDPDPTLRTSERFRHKNVEVKLSLNRAWELAALRPSGEAPPKDYTQITSWTVDVAWGELLDHASSTELSYLFWDGVSPAQSISYDPPFPQNQPDELVPLLDSKNSAAVAFDKVEAYLRNVLPYTGFPYYSNFPPYFVSQLNQKTHEYIALRFVPQDH